MALRDRPAAVADHERGESWKRPVVTEGAAATARVALGAAATRGNQGETGGDLKADTGRLRFLAM